MLLVNLDTTDDDEEQSDAQQRSIRAQLNELGVLYSSCCNLHQATRRITHMGVANRVETTLYCGVKARDILSPGCFIHWKQRKTQKHRLCRNRKKANAAMNWNRLILNFPLMNVAWLDTCRNHRIRCERCSLTNICVGSHDNEGNERQKCSDCPHTKMCVLDACLPTNVSLVPSVTSFRYERGQPGWLR